MIHAVYMSSANEQFSDSDLVGLLHHCRENNTRLGISGLLLHRGGNFMQALEGPEDAVNGLLEKIALDRRHSDMTVLVRESQQSRLFPEWSMGFRNVGSLVKDDEGANPFLDQKVVRDAFAGEARSAVMLLRMFRQTIR